MKVWQLISLLIIGFYSTYIYAETQREKATINKQLPPTKENKKQTLNKNQKKQWPPTFIPSEKINADTSVSFPVDI